MTKQDIEPKILELWTKTQIPLTKAHIQFHTKESEASIAIAIDELLANRTLELKDDNNGNLFYVVNGSERPNKGAKSFQEWDKKKALIKEAKSRILAKRKLDAMQAKAPPLQDRKIKSPLPKEETHVIKRDASATPEPPQKHAPKKPSKSMLDIASKIKNPEESLALALESAKNVTSKAFEGLDQVSTFNEERKSPVISAALSFFLGPLGWLYAGSFKEAIPAFLIGAGIASLLPSVLLFPLMMVALPASAIGGWLYAWQYNEDGSRKTLFLGDGASKKE